MTATLLLAALQAQASDVLPRVPKGAIYGETMGAFEDRVGD
jgi:hypothetical protein